MPAAGVAPVAEVVAAEVAWWSYTHWTWYQGAAYFIILILLAELLAWLVIEAEYVVDHLAVACRCSSAATICFLGPVGHFVRVAISASFPSSLAFTWTYAPHFFAHTGTYIIHSRTPSPLAGCRRG